MLSRTVVAGLISLVVLAGCSSGADDIRTEAPAETTTTAETTTSSSTQPTTSTTAAAAAATDDASNDADELYPDVLDATAVLEADGTWTFSATLSSPYDSPERYADAWRVLGPDGAEYGVRILTHDHASEQPFTRSHSGVEIPDEVGMVTIQGRDQVSGWGGATFELVLTR